MAILGLIREINSSHGKSYKHAFKVGIELEGEIKDNKVSGVDFGEVNPIIEETINELEGVHIDKVIEETATVENIAKYIIKNLKRIKNLYSVSVWGEKDEYTKIYVKEIDNK